MRQKRNWQSEERLRRRLKAMGIIITDLRKQKGLSRAELAEMVDISPSYLTRIETSSGEPPCVPSIAVLFDIAYALGIDFGKFLGSAERFVDEDMSE